MAPLSKRINKTSRVLTLDPSSTHLAYALAEITPEGPYKLLEAGIIWAQEKWSNGQKFVYMYNCLELLFKLTKPDVIITEAFFANVKMRTGSSVIPTINHFIQMLIYKLGLNVTYEEVSPTAWRKPLGIKADIVGNKKDYKAPTKRVVQATIGELPEELISNITGNLRSLPTDVPDAIAISLYVGLEHHTISVAGCDIKCYNKYSNEFKELIDSK